MSIKSLAYSLQQALPNVKRMHLYELIAAAYSFSSYAALNTKEVIFLPLEKPIPLDLDLVQARANQLGLNYDQVIPVIANGLGKSLVGPFDLNKLAAYLENAPDDYPGEILEGLNEAAEAGNGMAGYCLALILEVKIESPPPSSYWFKKMGEGLELSQVELDFAEAFKIYLIESSLYLSNLLIAGKGGNIKALLKLINYSPEAGLLSSERIPELESLLQKFGLIEIWQICRANTIDGGYLTYLEQSGSEGDIESLRQLVAYCAQVKPHWSAAIIEFAQLLGTDLTQGYAEAIDEHGDPYDDDVGGAVFVAEYDGISVEGLSHVDQADAKALSLKWYKQLTAVGKAALELY